MRDVVRVFLKASLGTGINMIIGLARNKLLALYLGPQGLGVVSMLQQFQATLQPMATLGGDAPLVQGLASRSGAERRSFLMSALCALVSSWVCCTIILVCVGNKFSNLLLGDSINLDPKLISTIVIPLVLSAASTLLMALLTTAGAVGSVQKGQIAGNVAGLLATIPMVLYWSTEKELFLFIFLTSIPLISILFAFRYSKKNQRIVNLISSLKLSDYRPDLLRNFLSFGGTTIITGSVVTISWLLIRRQVLQLLGPESLGFFSAVITLSGMSLSLLSTSLMSFYLPRFSAGNETERRKLLRSVLSIVLCATSIFLSIIQAVPELIVRTLYSERFLPMIPFLRWWASADALRSISYVFGIPVFAGRHIRFALFSEMFFSGVLLLGVWWLLSNRGNLIDLSYAYFVTYLLYLITTWLFAKSKKYI